MNIKAIIAQVILFTVIINPCSAKEWEKDSALGKLENKRLELEAAPRERLVKDIADIVTAKTVPLADRSATIEERETIYKAIIRSALVTKSPLEIYNPVRDDPRYLDHFAAILVVDAAARVAKGYIDFAEWRFIQDRVFKERVRASIRENITVDKKSYLARALESYNERGEAIDVLLTPAFFYWYQSVVDHNSKRDLSFEGRRQIGRVQALNELRAGNDLWAQIIFSNLAKGGDVWDQDRSFLAENASRVYQDGTSKAGGQSIHNLDPLRGKILRILLNIGDKIGHDKISSTTPQEIERASLALAEELNRESEKLGRKTGTPFKDTYKPEDIRGTFKFYNEMHMPSLKLQPEVQALYNAFFSRCWELSKVSLETQGQFLSLLVDNMNTGGWCLPGILNRLMQVYMGVLKDGLDDIFWTGYRPLSIR